MATHTQAAAHTHTHTHTHAYYICAHIFLYGLLLYGLPQPATHLSKQPGVVSLSIRFWCHTPLPAQCVRFVVNAPVVQLQFPLPLQLHAADSSLQSDVHVDYNKTRLKARISIIIRLRIDHCASTTSKFSARAIATVVWMMSMRLMFVVNRESWTATRHVIWHADSGTALARVNREQERAGARKR